MGMGVSLNNLLHYREETDFLDSIVTGDETWMYHNAPEKRDSVIWKHPGYTVAKNSRQLLVGSYGGSVLWQVKNCCQGETINADCYIENVHNTVNHSSKTCWNADPRFIAVTWQRKTPYCWEHTSRNKVVEWETIEPRSGSLWFFACLGSWRTFISKTIFV